MARAQSPEHPLLVAVVDRVREAEVHVRNGGTVPLRRIRLTVSDNGHTWSKDGDQYSGDIIDALPSELDPGQRAVTRLQLSKPRRVVQVIVTALAGSALQRWQNWVFVGQPHLPTLPPWPQQLLLGAKSEIKFVFSGQGPRRIITLINEGNRILRDCSVQLLDRGADVTALLKGTMPQRLAERAHASLLIEEYGPERAYTLAVRSVDFRGNDFVESRDIIVGRPMPMKREE